MSFLMIKDLKKSFGEGEAKQEVLRGMNFTVISVAYLLIGYAFVFVIDLFRIKRIPLDVALKNME